MLEPHQLLNLQKIENAWWYWYMWAYVDVEKSFYLFPYSDGEES